MECESSEDPARVRLTSKWLVLCSRSRIAWRTASFIKSSDEIIEGELRMHKDKYDIKEITYSASGLPHILLLALQHLALIDLSSCFVDETDSMPPGSLGYLAHCLQSRTKINGSRQAFFAIPQSIRKHDDSKAELDKWVDRLLCLDDYEKDNAASNNDCGF